MYPLTDLESSSPTAIRAGKDHAAHRHFGHRAAPTSAAAFAKHEGHRSQSPGHAASEVVQPFLGTSEAIHRLREFASKVALSDSPVLILGETGSGKGVLANWLHANSTRRSEEFLDLNCAGLDRQFLETELFGHERGAFTSAVASKPGLLEVANHGTVFLDEIGDVDLQVQP